MTVAGPTAGVNVQAGSQRSKRRKDSSSFLRVLGDTLAIFAVNNFLPQRSQRKAAKNAEKI
jgi:hypothetical protein